MILIRGWRGPWWAWDSRRESVGEASTGDRSESMVFPGVTAEQETVVFQHVGQGQRQRLGGGARAWRRSAGHDPARARACHQRPARQAQLGDPKRVGWGKR